MDSTAITEKDQHDPPKLSLGDLLYSQPGGSRPPETEWTSLVVGIVAGDQLALHGLFQRAHRLVFTLTLRIVKSPESAEELTMDTFHEVWRRAATYDPAQGSVLGWIMNVARSKAIDRLRFEQRKKRVDPLPDAPADVMPPSVPDAVDRGERSLRVRSAIGVLTPGERQAIELAFFGEHTYAEVAERLTLPLGTVKTRIRSGLAKLREALAEESLR